jgi:hypothetical protein
MLLAGTAHTAQGQASTLSLQTPSSSTGAGSKPSSVAVADVNNDGKLDVVTANSGTSNAGVLLGNGDGTFQPVSTYPTVAKSYPKAVTVADVSGDGKPDLIVASEVASASGSTGAVDVLLGNGNGTFQPLITHAIDGPASAVVIADVNTDGKPDILTTAISINMAIVLLGSGNGTFKAPVDYSTGLASSPMGLAVVDLNSDGQLDLLAGNTGNTTVSYLLGNGDGTFQGLRTYSLGNGNVASGVAVGDVNNDSRPDIFTANYFSSSVGVLLSQGASTFQPNVSYPLGRMSVLPNSVAVADLTGDGKLDLLTANSGSTTISVLPGNGNGTFLPALTYSAGAGSTPYSAVVADVNKDGKPDVLTANYGSNTLGVLLNATTLSMTAPVVAQLMLYPNPAHNEVILRNRATRRNHPGARHAA